MIFQPLGLVLFLVATTFVSGQALYWLPRRLRFPDNKLLQSACGLALSMMACLLPPPLSRWVLIGLNVFGFGALVLRRGSPIGQQPESGKLAELIPGVIVAGLVLWFGPFGDAGWSPKGDLIYRTGSPVAGRAAGPSRVLPESGLVAARLLGSDDPFLSGFPLPIADPRRCYLGQAHFFSGLDFVVLAGKVFPAVWILGSLAVGARLLGPAGSAARVAFGCLLFGSGFSFLAGMLPMLRSWQFRIWPFLTESTGLTLLLSADETACLLLLLLAALACLIPGAGEGKAPATGGAMLLSAAACAVQPALLLPFAVTVLIHLCVRALRLRTARVLFSWLTLLAVVTLTLSLFVSPVSLEPMTPMLRALDYVRLEIMSAIVVDALSFGQSANVLRALLYLCVFLILSLGLRAFVLPRVLLELGSSDEGESWMVATVSSLLLLGLVVGGHGDQGAGPLYWSLGLLLLWLPVSAWTSRLLKGKSLPRRILLVASLAAVSFPATINYLVHYQRSPVRRLSAPDVHLARYLESSSKPGEVVLHAPNHRLVSLAAHIAHRPTVVCYFGRYGIYPAEALEERSRDVREFFNTANKRTARAILSSYQVGWVLVDKQRPLPFRAPPLLQREQEGERYILYRVR